MCGCFLGWRRVLWFPELMALTTCRILFLKRRVLGTRYCSFVSVLGFSPVYDIVPSIGFVASPWVEKVESFLVVVPMIVFGRGVGLIRRSRFDCFNFR